MASTNELTTQAAAADTTDQLDAIAAQSNDARVQAAVQARRDELARGATAPARPAATEELPAGLNTDPPNPQDHYVLSTDGRKINAWGEEKGSPEDKKRW